MQLLPAPTCEHCGSRECVAMHTPNTAYIRPAHPHEYTIDEIANILAGRGCTKFVPDEIANRALSLCDGCAKENDAYWAEMWAEYHSGL